MFIFELSVSAARSLSYDSSAARSLSYDSYAARSLTYDKKSRLHDTCESPSENFRHFINWQSFVDNGYCSLPGRCSTDLSKIEQKVCHQCLWWKDWCNSDSGENSRIRKKSEMTARITRWAFALITNLTMSSEHLQHANALSVLLVLRR